MSVDGLNKAERHANFAESELARANKAGRLEAQAVHAGRAAAATGIATVYAVVHLLEQVNALTAAVRQQTALLERLMPKE
jgi:hypothetical protein